MQIDVSAEQVRTVLQAVEDELYASWTVSEVTVSETETTIELGVSGYDDSEYLDFSPVFSIAAEANEQFGDDVWVREVHFNPRSVAGTVVLKTSTPPSGEQTGVASYDVSSRFCVLDGAELSGIDMSDPPLIVGYVDSKEICVE